MATLNSCKEKTFDKENEIAAIKNLFNEYVQYMQNGDPDGIITLWQDDARRISPDFPSFEGKENIKQSFRDLMALGKIEMTAYEEPEIEIIDNTAIVYYNTAVSITPKNGGPAQYFDIKGIGIMKKQKDGSWLTYMDCMNSNPTVAVESGDSLKQEEPSVYY